MPWHLCHMLQVSYFPVTCLFLVSVYPPRTLLWYLKRLLSPLSLWWPLLKSFGFRIQGFCPQLDFNDRVKKCLHSHTERRETSSRELGPWSNIYHYQEFQSNIKESKTSWDMGTRTKESILSRTVLKTRLMMVPGEGRLQVKKFRDWLKHQNVLPIRTNLWHFVSKC